jgi:hypothetical protein
MKHLQRIGADCILLFVLAFPAGSHAGVGRYVDVNSASPASPYTNWATAARTIQDAVDAAVAGDQILVTNGVYQTSGRVANGLLTNRVAVIKPVTVRSVNGPQVTVIQGNSVPGVTAVRCVYLTNGASLSGFTLTNGATRTSGGSAPDLSGGGVYCDSTNAVISNCILGGNRAYSYGGGTHYGTLTDCTVNGNSAQYGGGAYNSTLRNCTFNGNSATGRLGGGPV